MSEDKPLLILDLDETLVYASADKLSDITEDDYWGNYYIYARSGLVDFLDTIQSCFSMAIWTSSGEDYSDHIVERFFSSVPLEFKWSGERCTTRVNPETREYYNVKNLKKVFRKYPKERVLMIDDTSQKIEMQYGNHVIVPAFEGEEDRVLEFLSNYLIEIKDVSDFRSLEKRGWLKKYS